MEENNQVQFSEDAGAELQGEVNASTAKENNAPQGLTEAQVRQIMAEERAKIAEESAKAFRAMQSMTDKKARQVATDAQKQLEAMKATGAQFTPDMEREFVNRTVNQYMSSIVDEQPSPAQAKDHLTDKPDGLGDVAEAQLARLNKKYGVEILRTDPEAKELDKAWNAVKNGRDLVDFFDKYEELLQAKAKPDKTPAHARIPSLGGTGGSSAPTPEKYKSEVLAARGKPEEIRSIKEKYRKAGVDVDRVKLYD